MLAAYFVIWIIDEDIISAWIRFFKNLAQQVTKQLQE